MKFRYNYLLLLLMTLATGAVLSGCTEDEDGTPLISYVRVTDPAASDSLLSGAWQGQMVAIIGRNLQSTKEVWFNDKQALVQPTFVTSTSVLVRVPSLVPNDITNTLKIVLSNGNSLTHDFSVIISRPQLNRLQSEHVNEDGTAVIYGNYLYAPITVTFSGNVVGEIISVKDDEVRVRVPEGAQSGPIRVASNFGVTESRFWFRDTRNIIASFDISLANWVWQGPAFIVASDPAIENISGKFMRVNRGSLSEFPYLEVYGGSKETGSDICVETRNVPPDAFENPDKYTLKFEINTQQPFIGGVMRMYMGYANNSQLGSVRNNTYYGWNANIDTKGAWETVSIPWASVHEANGQFAYTADGYAMFVYFHGPNPATYNFALDNFRVVPN